ncbi:amidohydrolase [Rhodococcus opacus]|uniref:amidohydrolase n=1 Tax=Rhodococcus opacus TaxID=37919 RepID=UPI001C440423|nr:amidohydrolase [Rhodococcus opacus]MBV6759063.1 amidohydrolase [Rhodococcus opacus]
MITLPIVLTDELRTKMHDLYRYLHANPELSMQEHKTAELIQSSLVALGIDTFVCGGTGVVGVLTNGEGPTVAFRADSDGLPIAEDTGVDYASVATGHLDDGTEVPVMHGCGHDTHVATLLTVAELLAGVREAWAGTIVFLFQPGEETAAGAKAMVEDGLWERAPKPEIVFGQHVGPVQAGTVHVVSGTAMAMADSLKVTVYGQGSHGSQPQDSIDPIIQGVNMINRIQTIVSREVPPLKPAVVTVATFHAGLKENIIADRAEFTINVRTLDPEVREQVNAALRRIIYAEADASGAPKPLIEELYTFPRNYSDPDATAALVVELRKVLGEDNVLPSSPIMGSEDFGLLAEAIGVPSVYWMFGGHTAETLSSGTPVPVNHSPFFAPVIEPTLTTGVQAAMTAILSRVGIHPM